MAVLRDHASKQDTRLKPSELAEGTLGYVVKYYNDNELINIGTGVLLL